MHNQQHQGARPDSDGRLDLQITLGDLIARTRHILLRRLPDRLNEITLTCDGELGAYPENGGQCHPLKQRPCVKIDLVL